MDHLSSSQIGLYSHCSLKYRFQYIDRLPKPWKASGLVFGSAIHAAIAWFHKGRLAGKEVTLEKLLKIFEADWYGQTVEEQILYRDGESRGDLILLGKEMLNLYFHQPHNGIRGTEIPFVVPLVHPTNGEKTGINLEGFIDLLEEDETIVEFKTSAKAMDLKDVLTQLHTYSYAYEMLHQRLPKRLKLVNFVKTKKPRMLVLETQGSRKGHERFFYLAKEILKGIRSGVFFPRQSFFCNGCEYEEPCQAWKGQ